MRQAFDAGCAAIVLIFLAPLLAVIALAIKLEDGGPVFYTHPRLGRDFRRFGLLKFRSMVPGADRMGGSLTKAGDSRVTRVGRWLRKHKLDELPQLVNILRGDLQLVGARPEFEGNMERFRSEYEILLRDRPGITDPATLAYRDEEQMLVGGDVQKIYFSEILPRKLALSLDYARHRTFVSDLKLLLWTLWRLCKPSPSFRESGPSASTGVPT
jgi:lipopolysaccharide/colanic/teichoic acid biosynthesis glycosyltransferase